MSDKPKHNNEHSTIAIGDVLRIRTASKTGENSRLMVCDRITESAARLRPLTKLVKEITPHFNEEKKVTVVADDTQYQRVSTNTPGPFVARLGLDWVKADFKAEVPGFHGTANNFEEKKKDKAPTVTKVPKPAKAPPVVLNGVTRPSPDSKCGYLWTLLEAGGMKRSAMVKLAVDKFGGTIEGVSRTISAIPSAMRKAGLKPQWDEEAA